jgi:hypothetical protein
MSAEQKAGDHHEAAARHHEQAAHFYREASRHYKTGKDYAHAAHKALTARGHALRAMEHGQSASAQYAEHEGSPLPAYLTRASDHPASTAVSAPIQLDGAALHAVAAEHHEAAVRHHGQAETHLAAEHYIRAYHETKKALDPGKHGIFHDEAAAMYHMEHCGVHPSAELG